MRTEKSLRNIFVAVFFQILAILISFFARQVFIRSIGAQYLGLNGLYSNILQMLSLAEMGFATSILYRLYQPIADNNIPKIKALMAYFKKIYIRVGLTILVLGMAFLPFLDLLIRSGSEISHAKLYYVLFLLATVSTYFFSYKATLILANQDKYITTIIRYSVYILMTLSQMAVLVVYKSYLFFLVLMLGFNILEGIFVHAVANRRHPYLTESTDEAVEDEEKSLIKKNVLALFFHNIGGAVINSTDNIIISAYLGLQTVGVYSNYYMIFNAVGIVLGQIFKSITASVGNLSAGQDKKRLYEVFCMGLYVNAFLFSVCASIIYYTGGDFVALWVGPRFVLDSVVFAVLVIIFYINGMRRITLVYRESLGLFWYDRFKPLAEGTLNIAISITLVKRMGLSGVFLGTLISMLLTSFWVEPYIVYKYAFEQSVRDYVKKYAMYMAAAVAVFAAVHLSIGLMAPSGIFGTTTIFRLLGRQALIGVISGIVFLTATVKTREVAMLTDVLRGVLGRRNQKRSA